MGTGRHRSPQAIDELKVGMARRGLLKLLTALCREYSVTIEDVLAGKRSSRIVQARDACISKVLLRTRMSSVETGLLFGMDHTSIIAAKKRYETRDRGRLLT